MPKQNTLPEKILEHWRSFQCPDCREGHREKCSATKENAKAFRIEPNGKIHYYCFAGCLMLDLDEAGRKELTESQFNVAGHYEQLRNSLYSAPLKAKALA